jgi:hypothetical protein
VDDMPANMQISQQTVCVQRASDKRESNCANSQRRTTVLETTQIEAELVVPAAAHNFRRAYDRCSQAT